MYRHISLSEVAALFVWQPRADWHNTYRKFLARCRLRDFVQESIEAGSCTILEIALDYSQMKCAGDYLAPFNTTCGVYSTGGEKRNSQLDATRKC